jgi:hypothetical protein
MTLTPGLRKLALTAHLISSLGWLGAVLAYLALAVAGLTSQDAQMARSGHLAMELTGWLVIVPLSLAALLTGLVQSLGTEWGLFRHYWVLVKFVMTVGAVTILLLHIPAVGRASGPAGELIHAGGGLLVLVAATALSVYKPWGRTPYGRRKQAERRKADAADPDDHGSATLTPWGLYVLLGSICLILLLVVGHLTGGHGGHGGH